ncbi:MAG: UDP-3-O-(3-hydroxymyristoyl)glucosamine N-acyltransferase [Bacteroidota bacterium]
MTIHEIAEFLQGELVGNGNVEILRVAKIEEAGPGDLTFLANPKYQKYLGTTRASAILVPTAHDIGGRGDEAAPALIRVRDPYLAFLRVLKTIMPVVDPFPTSIHPTAVIAASASLGVNVGLGAHVVVGDEVVIGDNTKIAPGCVLAQGVHIGSDCLLYANVTVGHQCRIGSRVIIHSGVVIGSDGFGFAPHPDGSYEKIPQLGIVVVEDDVEIGANCTIDRATLGETVLKKGVKLDNLIQIAHNVVVGEHTVMASQSGISGSAKVGKHVVIAGQVGIAGHLEIADRSIILGQSGVSKSLKEPGKTYFGTPVKEHRKAQRMEVAFRGLPELVETVKELQRKVEALTKAIEKKS